MAPSPRDTDPAGHRVQFLVGVRVHVAHGHAAVGHARIVDVNGQLTLPGETEGRDHLPDDDRKRVSAGHRYRPCRLTERLSRTTLPQHDS